MKVYYAHFMGIYDTPEEKRNIQTLERLGFEVVNPNSKATSDKFKETLKVLPYKDAFEQVFGGLVEYCDVFAFKALPDGRIPGGIAMELDYAKYEGIPIIELPSGMYARKMGRDDTREYLHDIGQR